MLSPLALDFLEGSLFPCPECESWYWIRNQSHAVPDDSQETIRLTWHCSCAVARNSSLLVAADLLIECVALARRL